MLFGKRNSKTNSYVLQGHSSICSIVTSHQNSKNYFETLEIIAMHGNKLNFDSESKLIVLKRTKLKMVFMELATLVYCTTNMFSVLFQMFKATATITISFPQRFLKAHVCHILSIS